MSTDAQATAIKAILAAATAVSAYDLDELQALGSHPARYVEVHLSRRFGGNVRGDSRENNLRRLQTRAVASSVSDARLIEDRIHEAFAHTSHDVDGARVAFEYESGGGVLDFNKEIGRYVAGLTDWTFTV